MKPSFSTIFFRLLRMKLNENLIFEHFDVIFYGSAFDVSFRMKFIIQGLTLRTASALSVKRAKQKGGIF